MAITWGATTLTVRHGTYRPPFATNNLQEIEILPDGTSNPASVYQQKGRGRDKVSFSAFGSESDHDLLQADYIALTEQTFNDGTNSFTGIIEDLTPARFVAGTTYVYDLIIAEV